MGGPLTPLWKRWRLSLRLFKVCRKLSELHKSRSGYCCTGGKESKPYNSTWKQARRVCRMKGQVSVKVMQRHCVRAPPCIFPPMSWRKETRMHIFKWSCASSLLGELFRRTCVRVCLTRLPSVALDLRLVDHTEAIWIHLRSPDKYRSDGVARAVLSQLRRSLPGGAEMDWGESNVILRCLKKLKFH